MPVAEQAAETVNPQTLQRWQIARELEALSARSHTAAQLEERIRERFLPKPSVWVRERGRFHWGVLLQISPREESQSYLIVRP